MTIYVKGIDVVSNETSLKDSEPIGYVILEAVHIM